MQLFTKPTLVTKDHPVGENTLVISEYSAAFYINHLLNKSAVQDAMHPEGEETSESKLALMKANSEHYLRVCAASVVQPYLEPGMTLEQEKARLDEAYTELKTCLTNTQLADMYTAVLGLSKIDPKLHSQAESSRSSSAGN